MNLEYLNNNLSDIKLLNFFSSSISDYNKDNGENMNWNLFNAQIVKEEIQILISVNIAERLLDPSNAIVDMTP